MAGIGKKQAFVRARIMADDSGRPAYVVYDTIDRGIYACTGYDPGHEKLIAEVRPKKTKPYNREVK